MCLELCAKCNVRANTVHMLFECDGVKYFWDNFVLMFRDFIQSGSMSLDNVLFGILGNDCEIINFCILHSKWFLYTQYKNNYAIPGRGCSIQNYYAYMKNVITIERCCNVLKDKYDNLRHVFKM